MHGIGHCYYAMDIQWNPSQVSEWVIKFNGLSADSDSEVHISRVIIAYTLESLSSQLSESVSAENYSALPKGSVWRVNAKSDSIVVCVVDCLYNST